MAEGRFRKCGKTEPATYGWTPVQKGSDELVLPIAGGLMIRARKEERILPASVVRDAVDEKVEQIETEQGRPVYKKERDSIKEEVLLDLLPRAFTRSSDTLAWVGRDRVLVFAASFKKAEELTSRLRSNLGSLPLVAPLLKNAPSAIMTSWVSNARSDRGAFCLGDKAVLRDPAEEGGIATFAREQLTAKEIINHLDCGKLVSVLQLDWKETLTFTLQEDLQIKAIKVSEELKEEAEATAGDGDAQADQVAYWLVNLEAFNAMLTDLFDALGGIDTDNMGIDTQGEEA